MAKSIGDHHAAMRKKDIARYDKEGWCSKGMREHLGVKTPCPCAACRKGRKGEGANATQLEGSGVMDPSSS